MSLNGISLISVVAFVNLVGYSSSWVLTDVNYDMLRKSLAQAEQVEDSYYQLSDVELMRLKFNLIYPGTKWCGPGNIADGYDDLGSERETDACCREHDHCPDLIEAGETKMNLTNTAFYTRLSCGCDEKFRMCLRDAGFMSSTALAIGQIYFDAIGTKCYREDYPVTGCEERGGWFNRKCLRHSYDKQGRPVYQWFDVPNF